MHPPPFPRQALGNGDQGPQDLLLFGEITGGPTVFACRRTPVAPADAAIGAAGCVAAAAALLNLTLRAA